MKFRIYNENGTLKLTKTGVNGVEQVVFSDIKNGKMATLNIDADISYRAGILANDDFEMSKEDRKEMDRILYKYKRIGKMIDKVEVLSEDTPNGVIRDADTILNDLVENADLAITGISKDIFNIYKDSKDKEAVCQMFFEFTGVEFEEYLKMCIKETTRKETVALNINSHVRGKVSRILKFLIAKDNLQKYLEAAEDNRTADEFLDNYTEAEAATVYDYATADGVVLYENISYCDDFYVKYYDFIRRTQLFNPDKTADQIATKEQFYQMCYADNAEDTVRENSANENK